MTARLAFAPDPENAFTNSCAILISATHPFLPRLPLPSRSKTTSRVLLQANGAGSEPLESSTTQRFMLHCLYCKRLESHLSGHLPAPSAGVLTNLTRFLVPPSQSLEHPDHLVHPLSSQS